MAEQLSFFNVSMFLKKKKLTMKPNPIKPLQKPEYDFSGLRKTCEQYIKEKYPKPVECEEYSDYLQMIEEETDLELAQRIREIAEKIERKIYEPQKKIIREIYLGK